VDGFIPKINLFAGRQTVRYVLSYLNPKMEVFSLFRVNDSTIFVHVPGKNFFIPCT